MDRSIPKLYIIESRLTCNLKLPDALEEHNIHDPGVPGHMPQDRSTSPTAVCQYICTKSSRDGMKPPNYETRYYLSLTTGLAMIWMYSYGAKVSKIGSLFFVPAMPYLVEDILPIAIKPNSECIRLLFRTLLRA